MYDKDILFPPVILIENMSQHLENNNLGRI